MTRTWLKSDHRWQHWNRIVVILTKFSSLAASKVVILITFNAAGLENFIKMTTFLSQLPSMRERPRESGHLYRYVAWNTSNHVLSTRCPGSGMTDTDRGAADGQSSSPCRFWRQLGPEVVLKGKPCHRVYAETGKNDDLVLVHHKGQFYAMDAWCSHLGKPLSITGSFSFLYIITIIINT